MQVSLVGALETEIRVVLAIPVVLGVQVPQARLARQVLVGTLELRVIPVLLAVQVTLAALVRQVQTRLFSL